eukprot:scaffold29781_cov90-Isochrysis_galbana.AAC.2
MAASQAPTSIWGSQPRWYIGGGGHCEPLCPDFFALFSRLCENRNRSDDCEQIIRIRQKAPSFPMLSASSNFVSESRGRFEAELDRLPRRDACCPGYRRPARRADAVLGSQWMANGSATGAVWQSRQARPAALPTRNEQPSRGQHNNTRQRPRTEDSALEAAPPISGLAARPAGDGECDQPSRSQRLSREATARVRSTGCSASVHRQDTGIMFTFFSLPTIPAETPMPLALAGHRWRGVSPQ